MSHRNLAPLAALLLAAPLGAQQTARDSARADSARRVLPSVTVTASRQSESAIEVPLAITVVPPERLRDVPGRGLDEALTEVPGVLAQSRYGSSDVRIVIRGFGARGAGDRSNAGTSRGIRVLLDGIPETEPDGRTAFDNIDLAAAEGVEVVRSNASSVWGNAAGGVVSVSSVPSFERGFLSLQALSGAWGLRRGAARAGTRMGAASLFGSATMTTSDGWRAHSESDRALFNGGLVAPVGERSRLGIFLVGSRTRYQIPGPLTQAQVDDAPREANATYQGRDERRDNRLVRLGATLEHRIGDAHEIDGMVFVNPKFLQRSERGTFRDFTRYHVGGNALYRNTRDFGARVRSRFLAGVDGAFQDGAILFYSLSATNGRGDTLRNDKGEGARNLGVFAQEELIFGGRVSVMLGARLDDITYYYEDHITPSLDDRKSFRGVTPKIGVSYLFSPTHSVYASVGGGVEAPAGNETDPAGTFGQDTVTAINPLLEPIRSTTYELGTKRVLMGSGFVQALSYDGALYLTDVRDEIVPYRGGRFYFTAGKARRKGAELGVALQARHGLSLTGSVTASDNRYVRYVVDSVHYGKPGALADYSDNRVVGVPGVFWAGSLGAAPAALGGASLRLSARGTSGYWADDANRVRVPGYALVDATLSLDRDIGAGGAGVRGFVRVENLLDREYIASAFLNPDLVGGVPVAFEPGLPRQLVVGVTVARRR